jgi:hypothetical protein
LTWYRPDTEVFEAAAKDKAPIVLYFAAEDADPIEASRELHCAELAKMSEGNYIFVMIDHNGDRTPSMDDGCPVPTSKLLSPNPSRDYNITKYPSYLVCDWHGNEYNRYTKVPAAKDVRTNLEAVVDSMETLNKKLAATLEVAQKALEEKGVRDFFKAANTNFKTGVIGLAGQEDTITLYRKVIDDARAEVEKILENRPADGEKRLKDMSKDYKDTELASEIKDALDILKG